VSYKLITEGEWVMSVWGMWGLEEGSGWGRVSEGSRRCLARAGTKGEAAAPYIIDGQFF
jgi:hypothetical protein